MSEFWVVLGAAILSGLGVGSGGFYLLYLTDWRGLGQYAAQGANLVFFVFATLASSLLNLRRGRLPLDTFLPVLLFGLFGAALGSLLTFLLPASLARRGFGLLMIAGGAYTLYTRARAFKKRKKTSPPSKNEGAS